MIKVMRQHKNYKEILRLEELLHSISGKPNKELERKLLFNELKILSDEIKYNK